MIVLVSAKTKEKEIEFLEKELRSHRTAFRKEKLRNRIFFTIEKNGPHFSAEKIKNLPFVEKIIGQEESYLLASREFRPGWKKMKLGGAEWKAGELMLAAGPCAIENEKDLDMVAGALRSCGGKVLRGGSFKPRTSPYSFQGLGVAGLKIHRKIADSHGLLMLTEVLDREDLKSAYDLIDVIQVGSRNMQNFPLLKQLGKLEKPVLLKRGFGATREEFLLAAEYILKEGNEKVMLCERGLRGFNPAGKHVLDMASVALLKEMTWMPVLVDPSHAAGVARLVPVLAKSAVIAGADGLLIEIHADPRKALSDGPQALTIGEFRALSADLVEIAGLCAKGRSR